MRILVALLSFCLTIAAFAEVHQPPVPDMKSTRKANLKDLGLKSYAVALSGTSVVDLKEHGIVVLYGSIFLKFDRSAVYLFENKKESLRCLGASRSSINSTKCYFKNDLVTDTQYRVTKEVYKTPDGFVINPVTTIDGQVFGNSYTKWALFSFPNAEHLIETLRQDSTQ
ncbi:MAG: hypothetical protein AAF429_02010 [Pseudomonadota bacterium]